MSKWTPVLSFLLFFLSCVVLAAPKSATTLIETGLSSEPPVSVSTQCELQGDDLEIRVGNVGNKNSAHLLIKDISVYRLNSRLRLPYPAWKEEVEWGEINYWDKYGARWSTLSGTSKSQCVFKFDRIERDQNQRLLHFELKIDCQGLSNPQVSATREFHISAKSPVSCEL